MKKILIIIFIISLINITNLNSYQVTIHNQANETVHIKLNTSQKYPCDTKKWYCKVGGCWCNCGTEFDVPALSSKTYDYKQTNHICAAPCTTSIETDKGVTKDFAQGLCSNIEAWIGKKSDGNWFISTTNLGYSHIIKNNTPWSINVYIDEAACHNDCWYDIPAGHSLPLNTDLCCIQAITWWAVDTEGNFKGSSTGRFDMVCHSSNWSIDKVGEIENQPVYDITRIQ